MGSILYSVFFSASALKYGPLSTGNDTVYWTDMGLNHISRAKRDQTWREHIITTGISRVEGIAVDWIAGIIKLYIKWM